jgi:hypothetical protein
MSSLDLPFVFEFDQRVNPLRIFDAMQLKPDIAFIHLMDGIFQS